MSRDEPIAIAMWAGPRNISTTMTRAFENRADTMVVDEPFYAYYLRVSGAPHPMRGESLAARPQSVEGVFDWLSRLTDARHAIRFEKHIAYHVLPEMDTILQRMAGYRTFLLIRDPRAMVASFANKYDDVAPIIDSLTVQKAVLRGCEAAGRPCPILDAQDILRAPREMLTVLCEVLDIPFTDEMLSWPAGPRESDGPWAAHWYDSVNESTGFKPWRPREVTLDSALERLAEACRPDYETFHARRLTVPSLTEHGEESEQGGN